MADGDKVSQVLSTLESESRAQIPPSSHEEKGAGVTSPNLSRSMAQPMKSQSSVYWINAEVKGRQLSTSMVPLKVMQ